MPVVKSYLLPRVREKAVVCDDPTEVMTWGENSGVMGLMGPNFFIDFLKGFVAQGFEIKMGLEIEPEFGRHVEINPEPHGGIGRDTTQSMNDFVDATWRDVGAFGQFVLTDAHGVQKFLLEDLAGMEWRKFFSHDYLSMIIHKSHIFSI